MSTSNTANVTTISLEQRVVTAINVFTVAPERQAELVQVLQAANDEVLRHLPGFVSGNIHRGLDGTRVVNYAQWESREHFEAMTRHPDAAKRIDAIKALVQKAEPALYELVSVHPRR